MRKGFINKEEVFTKKSFVILNVVKDLLFAMPLRPVQSVNRSFTAFRMTMHYFAFSVKTLLFLILFSLGCSSNKTGVNQVQIHLTPDRHSIKITGIDYAIMQDINRDSLGGNWQSLVPVYKMPADTDLKNYQPVQPGKYLVKDSAVVFTPDTPFAAQQIYFVRYYKFDATTSASDYIMGHNKLGNLHYTDLIFKQ